MEHPFWFVDYHNQDDLSSFSPTAPVLPFESLQLRIIVIYFDCLGLPRVALAKCGPHRLTVRTEPSQGSNRGSIPREVTKRDIREKCGRALARECGERVRKFLSCVALKCEFGGWAK